MGYASCGGERLGHVAESRVTRLSGKESELQWQVEAGEDEGLDWGVSGTEGHAEDI